MPTATKKKATPAPEPEEQQGNKVLRQAYGRATQQLRENHRDEFETLYTKAAADLGVTRSPRLTPEQKAEQTLDELLTDFPHLREKVSGTQEGAE